VSEERDGAVASGMPDTAGLAIDLAMEEARGSPALHGHVASFLGDQRSLIALQKHHLIKQFAHAAQLGDGHIGSRKAVTIKAA